MLKVKVKNIRGNSGGEVKNQFEITTSKGRFFQSYSSVIVFHCFKTGKTYLDKEYWDYSVTTGKYRNIFLREKRKDTERKIKSGEYILKNLN